MMSSASASSAASQLAPTTLDPGQLVALEALLATRQVTAAARRLGITQSAMSHRLRQLREALEDALLVRGDGGLILTPRAASILPPLQEALIALASAVAPPPSFDPASTTMAVDLAVPDLFMPVVPAVVRGLQAEAPGLELRIAAMPAALSSSLLSGRLWLALAPRTFADDHVRQRALGALRFATAGRRGHPALRRAPTVAQWLAYPQVVVEIGNGHRNVVETALAAAGLRRHVGLRVPSFLAGLCALPTSDLLMNVPMPLAKDVATRLGLVVRRSPLSLPPVHFALLWHERYDDDPAHSWVRERIHRLVRRHLHQESPSATIGVDEVAGTDD